MTMELNENPWNDEASQVSVPLEGERDEAQEVKEVAKPEPLAGFKDVEEEEEYEDGKVNDLMSNKMIKQPSVREDDLIFSICVIDFHHIRGPEIEYWCDSNTTPSNQAEQLTKFSKIWPNLPFQALPDGAHLFEETFSTFTLLYDEVAQNAPTADQIDYSTVTTLFGCACIRQLSSEKLIDRNEEITRSIVQKSVVVISRYPITIQLREKLSIITKSFFLQRSFQDKSIIKQLYDNVSLIYNDNKTRIANDVMDTAAPVDVKEGEVLFESDFYMGLNLKEMLTKYKRNLLVLFKAILLEKKIVFFSKNLLKLSNWQFSLLSLIPNLILNLQDCGSPMLDNLSRDPKEPNSFNILDRGSILRFIGLPLQIFSKGGFFEPYLSLQQLDSLAAADWYLIGTSNDLLLDQKAKIADLIIYVDTRNDALEFMNTEFEKTLQLTSQDKRFIDNLIKQVEKLSDKAEETSEITSAIYSDLIIEDLIRTSFENYLIGLLSSVKYDNYIERANNTQLQSLEDSLNTHNINQFNKKFIDSWKQTKSFKIFDASSYNEFFTMNEFKPFHIANEIENVNFFKFFNEQRDKLKTSWKNNLPASNKEAQAVTEKEGHQKDDKEGTQEVKKGFMQTWSDWANNRRT